MQRRFGAGGTCVRDPSTPTRATGSKPVANGTYSASILIVPTSETAVLSTDLTVFAWNDSGKSIQLLSVTLCATWGQVLANFSASGANWTTSHSVDIPWPDVFNVTSLTPLAGQIVSVADNADSDFGPSACLLS